MTQDPIELAMKAGQSFDKNMLIYKGTNENLKDIFNKYDVKDKDVLTVLASSDQALACYYCGAKTIDAFDRSYLTLYYYYLRKWLILYKNELYPTYKFLSFTGHGDIELYKLVCSIKVNSKREEEAKIFWKKFMEFNQYKSNLLFEDRYCEEEKPYTNAKQIKGFYDKEIVFNMFDISNRINLNKQYDVIYLSNMLEYKEIEDNRNTIRINLENLLKDGGIAICTYKIKKKNDLWHLKEINELTKGFLRLDHEYKHYEPLAGKKVDLAYSYRKRSK